MMIIPQRLFDQPDVYTLLRDGNSAILQKNLTTDTGKREGYLACHVLSCVQSGRQRIETYDGAWIDVGAGEAVLLRRGLYHISDFVAGREGFQSILFYFTDQQVQDFLAARTGRPIRADASLDFAKLEPSARFQSFAEAIPTVYADGPARQPGLLRLKITEMLHLLCQQDSENVLPLLHQISLPRKRGIRAFMERNYHKQLKVEDYAYLTGRSLSSFRRDFKAHFGQTPQRWLKEKRLAEALRIIRREPISVTQLAYEVGYDNVSYFIREFQQLTGQTPKQYMLRQ